MMPPLWQCFDCPRCGKNVARPVGASTWHSCGQYIHAGAGEIAVLLADDNEGAFVRPKETT